MYKIIRGLYDSIVAPTLKMSHVSHRRSNMCKVLEVDQISVSALKPDKLSFGVYSVSVECRKLNFSFGQNCVDSVLVTKFDGMQSLTVRSLKFGIYYGYALDCGCRVDLLGLHFRPGWCHVAISNTLIRPAVVTVDRRYSVLDSLLWHLCGLC